MSDKIKTLADAIRIGSTGMKQCFGKLSDNGDSVCALGAAMRATSGTSRLEMTSRLAILLNRSALNCPLCCRKFDVQLIAQLIIHFNDYHRLSLSQVADEIEKIETERNKLCPTN